MRSKISAGVLMALAILIPAAPAVAQTETPGLNAACQTVERKVYNDIRKLVTIDLDTATNQELRILTAQIMAATKDVGPPLSDALQERLKGTADALRAFLKADVLKAWSVGLRISVVRTLTGAGTNVEAAAQKVLDDEAIDAYLAYLNEGLYAARKLDCASQPKPTPSVAPSATTSVAPTPTTSASAGAFGTASASASAPGGEAGATSGGEGGGLPVTGADTGAVAGIGGALLLLGGAGYLIGRRRRSRFVA